MSVSKLGEAVGRRDGVAHGIGDVDGGRPGPDDLGQHLVQVLRVGAGGVHGRELDVGAVALGPLHHGHGHFHDLFPVLAELVHLVNLRGGEEHVDAGPLGVLHGAPGLVNVVGMGAGQRGDDGALDLPGDGGNRLEVAGGAGGEAGLDDVHVHPLELPGDFHLLGAGHADARRLLAVAEGGVQEKHFVVSHFFLYLKLPF